MENLVETVSVTPYSGAVSMGSMGSAEPINILRGVLEPINFWMKYKKIGILWGTLQLHICI